MNVKVIGKFLTALSLVVSSFSMATVQQTKIIITGDSGESGSGTFEWDDTGKPSGSILSLADLISLSLSLSGGNVIGGSTSFSLQNCTEVSIFVTPGFVGGAFNFTCDNGINDLQPEGSQSRLNASSTSSSLAIQGDSNNTGITLSLEEPVIGEVHGGIGNLRGWAISGDGIDRVEIYIDGKYMFDVPYGGDRTDVAEIYPDVPGSQQSGFSLAFGYSNLGAGRHSITARAYTPLGESYEALSSFSVVAFDKIFIPSSDVVDTSQASTVLVDDEIQLNDVLIDGRMYDLKLRWRTAEQGFEIVEIR